MRPRESHAINLEKCSFAISVANQLRWIRDLHENNIGIVDFHDDAKELVIEAEFVLNVCEENPFNFVVAPEAAEYPFTYEHDLAADLRPLSRSVYVRDVDQIRDWLHPLWHPGKRVGSLDLLQELNLHIYRAIAYLRRMEKGVQSPAETLEKQSGSCRDSATLFVEACRFLGMAARFVSGYMYSADITGTMSMHGWAEVYLPGAGWIGFDPSWGILASAHYFPVAVSRHSEHAPPISGYYMGTPRAFIKSEVELYVKEFDGVLSARTAL
jgi:transglutaminase-like putative cysteine protease